MIKDQYHHNHTLKHPHACSD